MEGNKEINVLYFNTRDELQRVDLLKVLYFRADRNYTDVFFLNGQHLTLLTSLLNLEQILDREKMRGGTMPFVRLGRSLVVNLSYVLQINVLKQELMLGDMATPYVHKIPVTKESLRKLKDLYNHKSEKK